MKPKSGNNLIVVAGVAGTDTSYLAHFLNRGPETTIVRSRLLCHPGVWSYGWQSSLQRFLCGEALPGYLSWVVPSNDDLQSAKFIRFDRQELVGRLMNSVATQTFSDVVLRPAYADIANFVDLTRENLYSIDALFGSESNCRAVLLVNDWRNAACSLSTSGLLPGLSANAWVFDTSIALSLREKYAESGRLFVVDEQQLYLDPDRIQNELCDFLDIERTARSVPLRRESLKWSDINADHVDQLVAVETAVSEFVTPVVLVTGEKLHRRFHLELKNGPTTAGLPGTFVESNRCLSDYEIFLLGRAHIPGSNFSWLIKLLAAICVFAGEAVRLACNVLIKAFMGCCGIWISASKFIEEMIRAGKWSAKSGFSLLGSLQGFLFQSRQFIERHKPSFPGRLGSMRNRFVGVASRRSYSLKRRLETEIGGHVRVNLPENLRFELICVTAFQGRRDILKLVVREALKANNSRAHIGFVLSCTTNEDFRFAQDLREEYLHVGIVKTKNRPLGEKWQRAVDCAAHADPSYLLITGSDDVVSAGYIRENLRLMRDQSLGGICLLGPRNWYMVEISSDTGADGPLVWRISYKSTHHPMPLGAGRIYSGDSLRHWKWQIFDESRERLLDDFGFDLVRKEGGAVYSPTLDDGFVLSVKGHWSSLNPATKILSADSVVAVEVNGSEKEFLIRELGETWDAILNDVRVPHRSSDGAASA
ncbi:MAG: hypothetical protein AB7O54_21620 [Pseudomonadales bacterium]